MAMPTAKLKDANGHQFYAVPSRLVHWAISSIITSSIVFGAAMVTWALKDIEWKTTVSAEMKNLESRLGSLEKNVTPALVTSEQLKYLERRVDKLEQRIKE